MVLITLNICMAGSAMGQYFNEFAVIDQKVNQIPREVTYATTSIAGYIRENFKTERERVRAIYTWVITNLKYDTDSMYHINWSMYSDEKIAATLRRRKGVCENYAALFTDIALKTGIQSFLVSGYTLQEGVVNRMGHSWCAVNMQSDWYLCDPTWDKDAGSNTKYFLVPPTGFIESHMPFDPLWQLLEYPLTDQAFEQGYGKRKQAPVNYKEAVRTFLQLDSLQQLEASLVRVKQAGIENDRVKSWQAYNKMKIAIIYGEQDMNLYNSAVDNLNRASHIFNDFVQYRNNRFMPVRPDAQMSSLLDPIPGLLSTAKEKLDQMGRAVENFQYDAGTIKTTIATLEERVNKQQLFLKQYLSGSLAERGKLFYQ